MLLAEDNAINQKVAVHILEKLNCRVDVVANGEEAVAAAALGDYHLCFMDCQMPELDGWAATAMIRAQEAQADSRLPIIAMTANAMPEDRTRCLEAGMDDYLSKPIRETELIAMLMQWGQPSVASAAEADEQASEPASTTAALNHEIVSMLQAMGDELEPTFFRDVIEAFFTDTTVLIATLQQALTSEEINIIECTAHTLKGSSTNVGAFGMAAICDELEAAGHAADSSGIAACLTRLESEFARVRRQLTDLIPSYSASDFS